MTIAVALACLATRADDRVDAVTNRLAQIIATSNYTFSIAFGKQGSMTMDGHAAGTSTAFRIKLAGREMVGFSNGEMWLPSTGTGGAARVVFEMPMHINCSYNAGGSAMFFFGVLPTNRPNPFLIAPYAGLTERIGTLPQVTARPGGWQFCDANETGTCVGVSQRADPPRVEIDLLRTEPDKSAVFMHTLRVEAGAPTNPVVLPKAPRTVTLNRLSTQLPLCYEIAQELQRAAASDGDADKVFEAFGRSLAESERGRSVPMPPLPPALQRPGRTPAVPPAATKSP